MLNNISEFIKISKQDAKAELEFKVLSGKIQTKNVADRITRAALEMSTGLPIDEHRLVVLYKEDSRVVVTESKNIHKVCITNSFRGIPLVVERKRGYFKGNPGKKDTFDYPEIGVRATLRKEEQTRGDWNKSPNDPEASIRVISRKSYKHLSELFRIDFSMVKSRKEKKETLRDILKNDVKYELEIEFVNKRTQINTKLIE